MSNVPSCIVQHIAPNETVSAVCDPTAYTWLYLFSIAQVFTGSFHDAPSDAIK